MIKFTIRELRYIRRDKVVTYYIQEKSRNLEEATRVMKSLDNIDKITLDTIFTVTDNFEYSNNIYEVLECEYGLFVTRADNIKPIAIYENSLERMGLQTIISSGNKTILIDNENNKYITTKADTDDEDIEKAVMLLLLKREGYTYEDVADLVKEIKYR